MKQVKLVVKNHVFLGSAIVRDSEGTLKEINLGRLTTIKKMTEKGMEKEFLEVIKNTEMPSEYGLVGIDVRKLDDETYTYTMSQEEFIEKANLEVGEEKPVE